MGRAHFRLSPPDQTYICNRRLIDGRRLLLWSRGGTPISGWVYRFGGQTVADISPAELFMDWNLLLQLPHQLPACTGQRPYMHGAQQLATGGCIDRRVPHLTTIFANPRFFQGFVRDVTSAALRRGCGVCVLIARGLMGNPINGVGEYFVTRRSGGATRRFRSVRGLGSCLLRGIQTTPTA